MTAGLLLEEHVTRVFERVLRTRGYRVVQAKDRFGEHTTDVELLEWCAENDVPLVTNDVKDFEPLHRTIEHGGLLVYHDQGLPDVDPEGLARAVDEVFRQYGVEGVRGELVDLDEWYGWLHR